MTPQDSGEWGIGIFYFPEKSSIPFYFSEMGDTAGFVTRNEYGGLELEYIIDTSIIEINYNDFNWLGHTKATLLKVYQIEGTKFYKVFKQSYSSEILIKVNDLLNTDIKYFTYRALLIQDKVEFPEELNWCINIANIGLNLYKSRINLRTGPSTEYEVIKCLKSNDWDDGGKTEMKIIENKGDWVKIKAETYVWNGEECGFIKEKDWEGWIKAFDENCKPNIWYSITSY